MYGLNNQKMKIKFLGTSAGWPLPRLGCTCELCSSRDPKDTRTRTQLLVNDTILLDAGPDTYRHLIGDSIAEFTPNKKKRSFANAQDDTSEELQNDRGEKALYSKKVDPTKIKAVLVSHAHLDHIQGFWDLTHIYNSCKPIDVFVTLPVLNEIRKFISIHGQNLKINVVKPNQPFLIHHVKVEYFPVIHGKTSAFGIKLKENKIFIYITDFRRILPSQERTIKYADYWAIDGSTLGKIGQGPGHISIQDAIQLAKKYKIKNTYFVHIGHKTGTHQFLEEYLKINAGPNYHIAFDGQELKL